jgi:hypothetical protein
MGGDGYFPLPDSVIAENSLTPENITINLYFGINSKGADTTCKYVIIDNVSMEFADMETEGKHTLTISDATKQGQPYTKELSIHTEGGFTSEKNLSPQDIVAFDNQDFQRLNFPYTFITVSGNLRKFPFANNLLSGDFQTIERTVATKLIRLSGKERITLQSKGYIDENAVFTYEGNYYIVSSEKINEHTDNNTVQLIRIDD